MSARQEQRVAFPVAADDAQDSVGLLILNNLQRFPEHLFRGCEIFARHGSGFSVGQLVSLLVQFLDNQFIIINTILEIRDEISARALLITGTGRGCTTGAASLPVPLRRV